MKIRGEAVRILIPFLLFITILGFSVIVDVLPTDDDIVVIKQEGERLVLQFFKRDLTISPTFCKVLSCTSSSDRLFCLCIKHFHLFFTSFTPSGICSLKMYKDNADIALIHYKKGYIFATWKSGPFSSIAAFDQYGDEIFKISLPLVGKPLRLLSTDTNVFVLFEKSFIVLDKAGEILENLPISNARSLIVEEGRVILAICKENRCFLENGKFLGEGSLVDLFSCGGKIVSVFKDSIWISGQKYLELPEIKGAFCSQNELIVWNSRRIFRFKMEEVSR